MGIEGSFTWRIVVKLINLVLVQVLIMMLKMTNKANRKIYEMVAFRILLGDYGTPFHPLFFENKIIREVAFFTFYFEPLKWTLTIQDYILPLS